MKLQTLEVRLKEEPSILATTLVAFAVSGVLVLGVHAPRIVVVIVFVGLTVAGLVLSLGRERNAGRN